MLARRILRTVRIVPALFLHGDPAAQVLLRQTATVAGAAHAPLGAKAELHLSFRSSIVPDTKVLVFIAVVVWLRLRRRQCGVLQSSPP